MKKVLQRFGAGGGRVLIGLLASLLLFSTSFAHTPPPSQDRGPEPDVKTAPAAPRPLGYDQKGRNLIRLAGGSFDPLQERGPVALPAIEEDGLPSDRAVYWLVQPRAGTITEAARAITDAGALVAGAVPDRTFAVRATPAQRELFARSKAIRWSGLFQPGWKIPPRAGSTPGLLDLEGPQIYRVWVFDDEPAPAKVRAAVASIDGVRLLPGRSPRMILAEATAQQVPDIAAVPAVEWIDVQPEAVPLNMNARWVTDTGIRDVYSATAPGRLTGRGQTAGVADTAINYVTDPTGRAQAYFRDCSRGNFGCKRADYVQKVAGNGFDEMKEVTATGSGHRKLAAYFDIGESGTVPPDAGSHGTHVAGSVTGDIAPFGTWQRADGMAPAARLVHQNISSPSGGLSLPADTYDLLRQSYRPRDPEAVKDEWDPEDYAAYRANEDARTHNNSYGLIVPLIDLGDAVRMDEFVWEHEDMTIVVSAGNGGPNAATIGSPSVAKNILSSAASANGRQPMASIDSLAVFSSHGPTADGQLGPDVATPGQIVVSAKGGGADEQHTLQGTSMSGPVLTGLATLVREYFYRGWGPAGGDGFGPGAAAPSTRSHNPSAALVRATVVNGAERMRGWYTGDQGAQRPFDGQWPSFGQGFGLVNLANSLFFRGDDLTNWYHDVWRADDEAFDVFSADRTRSYTLNVQKGEPLDVSMVYTDAPDLLAAVTPALVNNLDLTVTGPDGTTYVGNNMNTRLDPGADVATTIPGSAPPDVRNPEERVRVARPEPGEYTITVEAPVVLEGPQGFALAASGKLTGQVTPNKAAPALGRGLLPDEPGSPDISNIRVEPRTGDTAWVRWRTDEPTTGAALVNGSSTVAYVDSYNVGGEEGFRGLNEGRVETSEEYANKPMLGTRHEALVTGLKYGKTYRLRVRAVDRAGNKRVEGGPLLRAASGLFGVDAPDVAQLYEGGDSRWGDRPGATQMYVGKLDAATGALGAFMFRLPKSVDPSNIIGAAVQLQSYHDITQTYTDDARYVVDLLDESVEPEWGTQDYETIRDAPQLARLNPTMADRRGGGLPYTYSFGCLELEELRETLETEGEDGRRNAAFRALGLTAADESLFSYDIGFNRRSRGPANRPRLLLFYRYPFGVPMAAAAASPIVTPPQFPVDPEPCDRSTPAPDISEVRVAPVGDDRTAAVVNWLTDVRSDSTVLFREQGTREWTQVGSPVSTTHHMIEVHGLDPKKDYEFVVRSAACNGRETTDTNRGKGYLFFEPPEPERPFTEIVSYDFEPDEDGWTTESHSANPAAQQWQHGSPGHDSDNAWHLEPYTDDEDEWLLSPSINLASKGTMSVRFWNMRDTEPGFDYLNVDYRSGTGNWQNAGSFDGFEGDWTQEEVTFDVPAGELQIRFRFTSDELLSSPLYNGVSVDDVSIGTLGGSVGEQGPERLTEGALAASAEADGLSVPATRNVPTKADKEAGTAVCGVRGSRGVGEPPQPSPPPPPPPSPGPTPAPSPTDDTGATGEESGLPFTGGTVLAFVLVALGLLGAGAALVGARRRRDSGG